MPWYVDQVAYHSNSYLRVSYTGTISFGDAAHDLGISSDLLRQHVENVSMSNSYRAGWNEPRQTGAIDTAHSQSSTPGQAQLLRHNLMGTGSAFSWGWCRGHAGTCYVEDDKCLFYRNGQPPPGLYFRRLATVPVNLVCSSDLIGVLAITSMQERPFRPDILETMQFLASVIYNTLLHMTAALIRGEPSRRKKKRNGIATNERLLRMKENR